MKKFTFLLLMLLLQAFLYAQNVDREKVVLEIGTGTWCVYCPGAATTADVFVEEGKDVVVIENHNGDEFTNTYSNARNSYYSISSFPTGRFDGILSHVGGQACPPPFNNVYNSYLPLYTQRIETSSPYTIDMEIENTSGNNYQANITIQKVGDVNTSNSVVHFVVTESHLSATWFCMTECNFVNRKMVPNQSGTPLSLTNDTQQITLNFTLEANWVVDNVEFVCFIQSNSNKEIHQAIKRTILLAQFEADETLVCSPGTIHFTDLSAGDITSRSWSFPGGTPSSSNLQNPTVVYNNAGVYDVTLTVYSGSESNVLTKNDYIQVSSGVPSIPGQPQGETQLCKNPPNTNYNASGSANTLTWDWEINPSNAGLITNDGNATVTVNWFNSYLGDATLTVKAINGCGESDFSSPLTITLSPRPATFNLTGGGSFCEGEAGVEVGLDGSETGVTYQLFKEDQPEGTSIPGTGGPISFGLITEPGEYSSVGFNETTQCDIEMTNTVMVTMIPLPATYGIMGGGEWCEGMEGIAIGLEGSQPECQYELFCNDVTTGVIITGTGEALDFGQFTILGTYHIVATNIEAPCTSLMTGTADITQAPSPEIPAAPQGPQTVDLYYSNESEYVTEGS
ncbi:MAG TPA: PKD domain-containing protein, partial [Bacteroidales bacterium]|nr:PKD domain-containing protein [Bacteroidales bacterium]